MVDIDLLRRARQRIADPKRWCAGYAARTKTRAPCGYNDKRAAAWCGFGALWIEKGSQSGCDAEEEALHDAIDGEDFPLWQDEATHAQVLAVFDRVIETEQKRI